MESTAIFSLATDLVLYTHRSVFLTGKAGTGKTTFLKQLQQVSSKNMAITAPTGVAAINAGGVTLHSFFNLPFGPYLPGTDTRSLLKRMRLSPLKRKTIQALELLVIDEISMVRADLLDLIDTVLRLVRQRALPFGGVQVLLIGDMLQLPPVVKEEEWQYLQNYYASPYFFDAQVIREQPPIYVELDKVYRQSDPVFIQILNEIRDNELSAESAALLHRCYQPRFEPDESERFIRLTTHNQKAQQTNHEQLAKLVTPPFVYAAKIEGDFPDNAFPCEEQLTLKVGAQVMFLKNDIEQPRRYFNGKIGKVIALTETVIQVQSANEPAIEVKKEVWRNIRYTLNEQTKQLEEEELGTFSQFPLRLAWSITIHKSQGLTFEKAIVDVGAAFAPGQVYVALSRCVGLEGLVLQSTIRPQALLSDQRLLAFSKKKRTIPQLQQELIAGKRNYWQQIYLQAFQFEPMIMAVAAFQAAVLSAGDQIGQRWVHFAHDLIGVLQALTETANRFLPQLQRLMDQATEDLTADVPLQTRLQSAVDYFQTEWQTNVTPLLQERLSSGLYKHELDGALAESGDLIWHEYSWKMRQFRKIFPERFTATISPTIEKKIEDKKANTKKPKPSKGESIQQTVSLLNEGLSPEEIATQRNLAISTIEGHLLQAIQQQMLQAADYVSEEVMQVVAQAIVEVESMQLSLLKSVLPVDYSYGQIKLAIAALQQEGRVPVIDTKEEE